MPCHAHPTHETHHSQINKHSTYLISALPTLQMYSFPDLLTLDHVLSYSSNCCNTPSLIQQLCSMYLTSFSNPPERITFSLFNAEFARCTYTTQEI